ncbi:MAG: signal peptidase I [candidate division Zixibacteria bacterium]|nr:signal peptidase I [candidate division Zixibacteria bacterium]
MVKKRKKTSKPMEFLKAAIVIALIGLVLRIFIFMPYRIADPSMENALYEGDFMLTSKLSYSSGTPQVGDLVVFEHPLRIDEIRSGRVAAVEGQTVEILDKLVYVDDEQLEIFGNIKHVDNRVIPESYGNRDYLQPYQVPAGAVYILGDNRDEAEDSRNFGVVNLENIKGKALFVYWSWRPDPEAPEWESPYIFPAVKILFYNLVHFPSRIGWDRLGASGN